MFFSFVVLWIFLVFVVFFFGDLGFGFLNSLGLGGGREGDGRLGDGRICEGRGKGGGGEKWVRNLKNEKWGVLFLFSPLFSHRSLSPQSHL